MSELRRLQASCLFEISNCNNLKKLEVLRNAIFGKNGKITEFIKGLRDLDDDQRRKLGAEVNSLKNDIMEKLNSKLQELEMKELDRKLLSEFIDVSLPPRPECLGKIHPLTKVEEEISTILSSYGFACADGPDIEDEYFNFTAMNMPDHHPARTMHDTFYVHRLADEKGRKLLRTHTSPVQIRTMLAHKPPLRFFSIGRVYRSDYDATHTPMFSQVEGIMIEKNVGFSHLKWIVTDFLRRFFEVKNLKIRFRPSFFPFTEPSAEVDINYEFRDGKIVCGVGNKWLEVCGCGVIHPNVLGYGNVDANTYQGVAFGFGLERLTSLKYGIPDLRGYFEPNERWIDAFGFSHASR
ncbi:MAG: phenylalanine--tRNA ligase subunit alpha [Holosporaceae bacterium]|jgi:phenylalanyl-tRNA synthetase alpha chain|nr:phenylalanine--tRNA ligase subunit alpha [Holosporaceae bacterium]